MLSDKVVIVAGGAGRLGSTFVDGILNNNGICVVADVSIDERIKENNIKKYKDVGYLQLDITSKQSLQSLIDYTVKKYNKIDAFVNTTYPRNANWGRRFEEVDYTDFCENACLHLGGYFLAAQQVCTYFKKQGYGNIVQVASIMGVRVPKFDTYTAIEINGKQMTSPAEYSIFKAGIIHFSSYLAKYYKDNNIRSNCLSPGGIYSGQPEIFCERYKKHCTSKGMLDPDDVLGALLFLLSDQSTFINGQNIIVDDGWCL